ncbi:MAG: deoxyribodipyrimidine photo-lyase [Rhodothermales bacterium]|nr:deoxyribodipyrimidine photo-lyase [Rhodothermales bacterium]MBO6780417.1 deoxyribodipyrimidine photo-lyase [Rhodothermales bacterium]
MPPVIVWFENDLRKSDHAALQAAADSGQPVIPFFAWNGGEGWADGSASRWWLHHSLAAHAEALQAAGLQLVIRQGDPADEVVRLACETGAEAVYWQERPEPHRARRDDEIQRRLEEKDIDVRRFAGALLHNPDAIQTGSGGPYKVFTPFYKKFLAEGTPVDEPSGTPRFSDVQATPDVSGTPLEALELLPKIDWAGGIDAAWNPGERSARGKLSQLDMSDYADERDIPSIDGTSQLSPHLHFGEISIRQAWHASSDEDFRRELVWRDFAHHVLHHFPHTVTEPLREEFEAFPWREDSQALQAWQQGRTGYPMVDAGMRQLWETGWMHNRVRMIVASFLTKHLLLSWRHGQAWFNDTLVDADLANNTFGWQWAGGCGADAQPFFRIFNPITQGDKFDPDGAYVRKWVPELKDVPDKHLFEPWDTDVVPEQYPAPIVEHKEARERALEAYQKLKN